MKKKGKSKMTTTIIILVILAVVSFGGVKIFKAYKSLEKEHVEAKNLSLNGVDFSKLKDGNYVGEYEGGMNKWRANKIQVTVSSGKVTDIKILEHKENMPPEFTNKLYDRVIKAQSLQVDTISGATLTSNAYLKGVEKALVKAEK